MNESIGFMVSAILTYAGFDLGERYLKRDRARDIRFIVKGYHIHHSVYGALAILFAFVFLSGVPALIGYGFAFGNIWQHKRTHNKVDEKGLVFISKLPEQNV